MVTDVAQVYLGLDKVSKNFNIILTKLIFPKRVFGFGEVNIYVFHFSGCSQVKASLQIYILHGCI